MSQTEWKGQNGGIKSEFFAVARSQQEFDAVWKRTHSNTFPPPEAPKLPADKMAIAIFTGEASQPVDIKITDVEKGDNDVTTIKWQANSSFSPLCVMNSPYLIQLVDKADAPVEFERQAPQPPKSGLY